MRGLGWLGDRSATRKRLDIDCAQDVDALEDLRLLDLSSELEMRDALHAVPLSYREPLLLQVIGGFSCEEIAKLMQLTPGAVTTRLSRARSALRKRADRRCTIEGAA